MEEVPSSISQGLPLPEERMDKYEGEAGGRTEGSWRQEVGGRSLVSLLLEDKFI
jgi:hypothetical protein